MNIKQGDYITCKTSFYKGDEMKIGVGGIVGRSYINVFRKPIFKKGKKYLITDIRSYQVPIGGTGGLYRLYCSGNPGVVYTYSEYYVGLNKDNSKIRVIIDFDIEILFYTTKELRKIKLKRINK